MKHSLYLLPRLHTIKMYSIKQNRLRQHQRCSAISTFSKVSITHGDKNLTDQSTNIGVLCCREYCCIHQNRVILIVINRRGWNVECGTSEDTPFPFLGAQKPTETCQFSRSLATGGMLTISSVARIDFKM